MIEVYIGDHTAYGYIPTVASVDTTLQQSALLHPEILGNYTRKTFYIPGDYACADSTAQMTMLTGHIMAFVDQLRGFRVLFSPGRQGLNK